MVRTRSQVDDSLTNEKLDAILQKLDIITTTLHEMNNFMINTMSKEMENTIKTSLVNINRELDTNMTAIRDDIRKVNCSNMTKDIEWNKKLTKRKFLYYEAYRMNNIAYIYKEALNSENVKIPRIFFKYVTQNQEEMDRNMAKEFMAREVRHEIRRLRSNAEFKLNYVNKIDCEINRIYEEYLDISSAELQKRKWRELTEAEETNSHKIWEEKSKFFSSDKHLISIDSENKAPTTRFRPNYINSSENYQPRSFNFYRPKYGNRGFRQNDRPVRNRWMPNNNRYNNTWRRNFNQESFNRNPRTFNRSRQNINRSNEFTFEMDNKEENNFNNESFLD